MATSTIEALFDLGWFILKVPGSTRKHEPRDASSWVLSARKSPNEALGRLLGGFFAPVRDETE